jgi:short-subunit dehydrogenase
LAAPRYGNSIGDKDVSSGRSPIISISSKIGVGKSTKQVVFFSSRSFSVSFMYAMVRFTASQRLRFSLLENLATSPTATDMSGRVHIAANNKDLTASLYGKSSTMDVME